MVPPIRFRFSTANNSLIHNSYKRTTLYMLFVHIRFRSYWASPQTVWFAWTCRRAIHWKLGATPPWNRGTSTGRWNKCACSSRRSAWPSSAWRPTVRWCTNLSVDTSSARCARRRRIKRWTRTCSTSWPVAGIDATLGGGGPRNVHGNVDKTKRKVDGTFWWIVDRTPTGTCNGTLVECNGNLTERFDESLTERLTGRWWNAEQNVDGTPNGTFDKSLIERLLERVMERL